MKELTDEELRILTELEKAQVEKEAIPDAQKIPVTNPDKYAFSIGISDNVILCPYCLGFIDENIRFCTYCNGDATADAPIEMTLAEYNNVDRVKCRHCNGNKLRLAKTCPVCGK